MILYAKGVANQQQGQQQAHASQDASLPSQTQIRNRRSECTGHKCKATDYKYIITWHFGKRTKTAAAFRRTITFSSLIFCFPYHMKTLSTLRLLAATLFISSATLLGACSTGTDNADTDVERGAAKDFGQSDATPGRDLDSMPSTRAIPDTAGQKTIEQQYDQTLQATDHNHDGKAD